MSGTVVFFFFTSLYLRRILWRIRIVFARPHENTKTIEKQWKYDVWHHRFQQPPFTRKRQAGVFKNSTLGTVFNAQKYRLHVSGRKAKQRKEIRLFSKIPGYMWTRPKVSL